MYWQTRLEDSDVWIGDPAEAMYVESSPQHLLEIAKKVEAQGLIKLDGEWATANPSLMEQASKFEADMRAALEELEKKHAFERG